MKNKFTQNLDKTLYPLGRENKKKLNNGDVSLFAGFNDHSVAVIKRRGSSCHEYANTALVLTINADLPLRIKSNEILFLFTL